MVGSDVRTDAGPGHRFTYADLLSGNFSVSRQLFERAGGFDEKLHCHEDYELGYRLIAAGARFQFVPAAAGWHHEHTDLARALGRKHDEGRADVALAQRYPKLAAALPLARPHTHLTRRGRLLRHLAVAHPAAGNSPTHCAGGCSAFWRRRGCARGGAVCWMTGCRYWSWRGVGESLGGASPDELTRAPETPPVLHALDLRGGLTHAAAEIDAVRPQGVSLQWGPLVIGTIAPEPGAEPLQGRHLRSLLRTRFAPAFRQTLALAHGETPPTSRGGTEQPHALAQLDDRR